MLWNSSEGKCLTLIGEATMKYIALDSCRKRGRTDALHFSMFHGEAVRTGIGPDSPISYSLGDNLSSPLLISMSGRFTPDVFMPSSCLVISRAVQESIGVIRNTELAPVVFPKLVNVQYAVGDFSYYESDYFLRDPSGHRSDLLLGQLPDDPALHSVPRSHMELVLPNMYRLKSIFADAREATVTLAHRTAPVVRFLYAPSSVAHYPAFWSGVFFIQRSVFDHFQSYIDWDYFTSADIDL